MLMLLVLYIHSDLCDDKKGSHSRKRKGSRKGGKKDKSASANSKNQENLTSGPPKAKKGFSPKLLEMKRKNSASIVDLTQQVMCHSNCSFN